MKEIVEFRIDEGFAHRLFADDEGVKLGIARKITISPNDPRFARIGELQKEITATTNRAFFYGRRIQRQYTPQELEEAELLKFVVGATFEPAGEECGTKYDESTACPKCGAGATQISDLYLDLRKVPKRKEIATTIANEIIVSQRLAERMIDAGLTGFELRPVRYKARYKDDPIDLRQLPIGPKILMQAEAAGSPHPKWSFYVWLNREENRALLEQVRAENVALREKEGKRNNEPMPVWHQLVVTWANAEIVPPTRAGIDPFDEDPEGKCRCPLGDSIGLNLLSEVSISAASRGKTDIVCSRQFIGFRRGLLRPRRVIFISPKFWKLIESENLKGVHIEVAHFA